jgi:bifunctional DNA-binding transcriptional regulator/antitoxin component of YhaV-PrlF toxin-antitoxin module
MVEAPAKVISGGRVTLDSDIRRDLDIQEGDYVLIDVRPVEGHNG